MPHLGRSDAQPLRPNPSKPNYPDITIHLSEQDLAAIDAALETIRSKFPQRGAVSAADAKRMFKPGENSLGFVELAQETSREHAAEMADAARPAAFDASPARRTAR